MPWAGSAEPDARSAVPFDLRAGSAEVEASLVDLLAIYLNDHLAGSTAARELVRRAASSNRGSDYSSFLDRLATGVDEDRDALLAIMRALGAPLDHLKVVGGWGAEKLGRLKLNGRLLGYSPLSRLLELETLALGVRGKLGLWVALELLAPERPELAPFDLQTLIDRAECQLEELEAHRLRAAAEAFSRDPDPAV
jgi:hypothetical protein